MQTDGQKHGWTYDHVTGIKDQNVRSQINTRIPACARRQGANVRVLDAIFMCFVKTVINPHRLIL